MKLQDSKIVTNKVRYLTVGGFNTVVGYFIGVFGYMIFHDYLPLVMIGVISNILAISFSFVTYKLFVFQTQGRWLTEYLKSYIVYGSSALLGIGLLWLLVGQLTVSIWFAQGIIIIFTIIVSYLGHSRFTFRRA